MKVLLNDEPCEVADGANIVDLLNANDLHDFRGWAVAVNQEIIPNSQLRNKILSEGDELLLIQATQGG